MNQQDNALLQLGEFITSLDRIDEDTVRRIVELAVLDGFGCMVGGADMPTSIAARESMQRLGLTGGDSMVFGADQRMPAPTAAFLNGVSGHALEFDDWEIPGNTHPTAVLLPALLAVADADVSGDDLLTAYVAGFETIARLGEAMNFEHYDAGWHSTATLGAVGAAAAVARLQQLDPEQTAHALSIAISRATGYTCQFGADTKALQAGFAAESGVMSAALAGGGLTGRLHTLTHPRGMAALMGGYDVQRFEAALGKLGSPLAVAEYGVVLKPWPSCGYTHRVMCCALELADRVDDISRVQSIDIYLPDFHAAILPFMLPQDRREALFSLPFVAAMGLIHQGLTCQDLNAMRWQEEPIASLMPKISVHPFKPGRPELNYDPEEPDRMVVHFDDGSSAESACALPIGAPERPLDEEAVVEKFCDNVGTALNDSVNAVRQWTERDGVLALFEAVVPSR